MERIINNAEKIDSGSNYSFPDKMEMGRTPRSVFNLSHLVTGTIPNAGLIVPILWFEYMPTDSFDISLRHIIRVMPQVVPLYSRQRVFFHAFASNYADLQEDFQVLMTKGYTGNIIKKIAPCTYSNFDPDIYNSGQGYVEPDSLADYLGLPQGAYYSNLFTTGISCLPFLMYESIYKNYYMNKNYHMDNKNILPDNPDSFRVDENGVLKSNTDNDHSKVYFGKLHYRDYPDDYFTSALPFAQRGERPTLEMSISGSMFDFTNAPEIATLMSVNPIGGIDVDTAVESMNIEAFSNGDPLFGFTAPVGYQNASSQSAVSHPLNVTANTPFMYNGLGDNKKTPATEWTKYMNNGVKARISTTIGLDEIRELARAQVELEKMARTDGSYNSFGLTFFGRGMQTGKRDIPLYIGSTYDQLSFTEVLQTSSSTESSALGQIAGHGISVGNNGYIGHFNASDYGIIMVLMCIMPDVYYFQGLDKKWTRKYQSEFYLPERAKMGLQPIKNQEIYYSGSQATDEDLFAYQNPFDDFRYMQNRICGKIADENNISFFPYTQARKFGSLPTLSQSFAVADDIRKDYLFSTTEDAYSFQVSFNIRGVRPLPYKPIPNNFGF